MLYKQDIEQGNFITPGTLAQLKLGMTEEQVRYLMGTPVLQSAFNKDRWDYIYTYQPGHSKQFEEQVTLFFKQGKLKKINRSGFLTSHSAETTSQRRISKKVNF